MSEGTKTVDVMDAMARIDSLEARFISLQICVADIFNQLAEIKVQIPSATQVAEAA